MIIQSINQVMRKGFILVKGEHKIIHYIAVAHDIAAIMKLCQKMHKNIFADRQNVFLLYIFIPFGDLLHVIFRKHVLLKAWQS